MFFRKGKAEFRLTGKDYSKKKRLELPWHILWKEKRSAWGGLRRAGEENYRKRNLPELRHWRACGNHPHFSWWRHLVNRGHALAASLLTAKEKYVKPALNNNTGAEGGSQDPRNADSIKRNGNVLKLTTVTGYNKIYWPGHLNGLYAIELC